MSRVTQTITAKSPTSLAKALEPFALCFTAFIAVATMVQIVLPLV